jgi:predicted dinucleotide-binding enzyme
LCREQSVKAGSSTLAREVLIMKVAIIGTGNVGAALGSTLVKAGHEVTFAARDGAKTRSLAQEVGAGAAPTPLDAAAGADVIILAVPFPAEHDVARQIAPVTDGKVVIDTANPLKPDYSGLATGPDASGAELVAADLPGARVAKAFNTLFAGLQADPGAHGTSLDVLIATDDAVARDTVAILASSAGFRPVVVGPLAAARELEAVAWLNIRLQLLHDGRWDTAVGFVAPPAAAVVEG